MKKLLPLILILILLLPESNKVVDKYILYAAEGMVGVNLCAFEKEEVPDNPKPDTPTNYKCNTCKDTGIIKPDGVVEIPCPDCRIPKQTVCECVHKCGIEGCNCQSNKTIQSKEEVVQIVRKVKLFTQPSRCPPCREWESKVKPKLIAKGFKVGNKDTDDIEELDPYIIVNGNYVLHPLWQKYSHLGNGGVPLFLAFEGEKLVGNASGFIDETATLKLLGK